MRCSQTTTTRRERRVRLRRHNDGSEDGTVVSNKRSRLRRTEDRKRTFLDRYLGVVIGGILATLVVFAVLAVSLAHTSDRLNGAIDGSCQRLQVERDINNVQSWVIYRVIQLSGNSASPKNAAKISVLLEAVSKSDRPTYNLLVALLAGQGKAAPLYSIVLLQTKYAPPTDCHDAVDSPEHYRAPDPVPFRAVAKCFHPELVDRQNPSTLRFIRPAVQSKCSE